MFKSYEFQEKNVEKALEKASEELNIPQEKIKYEVVTYGSTGIFGLVGVKKAKIKVVQDIEKQTDEKLPPTERLGATTQSSGAEFSVEETPEGVGSETNTQETNDDELIRSGILALQKIVDGISAGATVDCSQKREKLFFSVSGGESGVLIGKRGQTLEAIQFLLEKMINKKSTKRFRVMVDVEGYLEKRKINLQQMASRMAEKAKKIRKPVTIGQMNAHDRRIVHIHLKDEDGVRTQSIGDGYYRKLMIFPKKNDGPKSRPANLKV